MEDSTVRHMEEMHMLLLSVVTLPTTPYHSSIHRTLFFFSYDTFLASFSLPEDNITKNRQLTPFRIYGGSTSASSQFGVFRQTRMGLHWSDISMG